MKYKKIHVEITNVCHLKCTFCPPKILPNQNMSTSLFEKINQEAKAYTNELAYHVVGDPLVVMNLSDYLDISEKNDLKVNITTTANNLKKEMFEVLLHPALKQVNFSLNSYNANSHKKSLDEYLKPIFDYLKFAIQHNQQHFINLRIWNLDDEKSAKAFNQAVFDYANKLFNTQMDIDDIYEKRPKNIRIASKLFFNFDDYFEWPSLDGDFVSNEGFCYGLDSHFSILASGKVTPCCLDKDGVIDLGDLNEKTLEEVLNSKRVKEIQKGFKNNRVVEELCKHCSYRIRFD